LEQRILYSADTGVLVDLAGEPAVEQRSIEAGGEFLHTAGSAQDDSLRSEIVFVDAGVEDYAGVLEDVRAGGDGNRRIEVVLIGAGDSGIERIGEVLAGRDSVSAVHLISHAREDAVQIGTDVLDLDSLIRHAKGISQWGNALTADADLLIYGCDVASQADGRSLMDALARLTGADVAASNDLTGAAALGGDWQLEVSTGAIETDVVLSTSFQGQYRYTWALIAEDGFGSAGSLVGTVGGSGWSGAWSGDSAVQQEAGSLIDPGGALSTSGGSLRMIPGVASQNVSREMASAVGSPGTQIWLSFLVRPDDLNSMSFGGVILGAPGSELYAGYQGNEFLLGTAYSVIGIVDTATPVVSGETAFLVLKLDFAAGNDSATLYVNPSPGAASPDSLPQGIAVKADLDLGTFSDIGLTAGKGLSANAVVLDELRIGSSYLDVAPAAPPPPASPTATGLGVAQVYVEDSAHDLNDIEVSDADSTHVSVTLELSDPAAGVLSIGAHGSAASTFVGGVWTASGAIADVNELLEDVRFVPTADYNAAFTVQVCITDGVSVDFTGTIAFSGTAVNDAPQLALAGDQASVSDGTLQVVSGFANAGPGGGTDEATQAVSISVLHVDAPALFAVQPHIDGSGTLRYQALAGAAGTATVTVQAQDSGGSAMGGQDSSVEAITITLASPPPEPAPGGNPPAPMSTDASQVTLSALDATVDELPSNANESAGEAVQADEDEPSAQAVVAPLQSESLSIAEVETDAQAPAQVIVEWARYPELRMRPSGQLAAAVVAQHVRTDAAPHSAALVALPIVDATTPVPTDGRVPAGGSIGGGEWIRQLDDMRRSVDENNAMRGEVVLANVVLGGGLSVGYVMWLLRGGLLLSTLVSTLPAWAVVDPLPVLSARKRRDEDARHDDPLERLFSRARAALTREKRTSRSEAGCRTDRSSDAGAA